MSKLPVVQKSYKNTPPSNVKFSVWMMFNNGWTAKKIAKVMKEKTGVDKSWRTIYRWNREVNEWFEETPGIDGAQERFQSFVSLALIAYEKAVRCGSIEAARDILKQARVITESTEPLFDTSRLSDKEIVINIIEIVKKYGDNEFVGDIRKILDRKDESTGPLEVTSL